MLLKSGVRLKELTFYRVDISKSPKAKKDHSVRTIPHIIIFKDGQDEKHFKAGIGFTLGCYIRTNTSGYR